MNFFRRHLLLVNPSTLKVTLPHILTRESVYILVEKMFKGFSDGHRRVTLDFTNLTRIQVGGVAVLSNMIEIYKKAGIRPKFIKASTCGAASFLDGSGFSMLYLGGAILDNKSRNEFLALKLVEYKRSHSYLDDDLVPWISKILSADVRALSTLKVCFQEIFNNIQDHSTVNIGCSCAHYDQSEEKITICISDFGVGIPNKVRDKMIIGSDHAAIAMACQEGFTTKSTPGNMGAGLHVLIRNVVTRNSGSVIICSGKGVYTCFAETPGKTKRTGRAAPHSCFYPGTLIYVTLYTKKFVPSEIDGEEFIWE